MEDRQIVQLYWQRRVEDIILADGPWELQYTLTYEDSSIQIPTQDASTLFEIPLALEDIEAVIICGTAFPVK
ncbi:MAG: hypothetical protein J6I64_07525 [Lachnospiraceae bacterium]|nr:hypothetical protein [Lachnospiraceae bacterium]